MSPKTMYTEDAGVAETQRISMYSSWWKDPKNRSWKRPLHWLAWRSMYKGEQITPTGKIATYGVLEQNAFLIPRILPPIAAQFISMKYLGFSWPTWFAYTVYSAYLLLFMELMSTRINKLAEIHGFLDGNAKRDKLPDQGMQFTVLVLLFTTFGRPALSCFTAYDRFELPQFSLWLPLNIFLYTVALDFWFYVYHRAMHEVDFLWKYHRTHHLTKRPTHLLSAFGGPEQDLFDIILIPLLAWSTYRVDFYTWWIATCYVMSVETAGHSGLRLEWRSPTPFNYPLLNWIGADLALEDHDLHHRLGWKKSHNYGKQTRIWDALFGTKRDRVELIPENLVEYSK